MDRLKSAKLAFFGAAALCLAQAAWAYAVLPARVASHFDAAGAANAWMSKGGFLGLNAAVVVLLCVVLLIDVFRQTIRFNLGRGPRLEHPLGSLFLYAAFTVIWLAAFRRRFREISA